MCAPDASNLDRVASFENLLRAWQQAARGKRSSTPVAAFEHRLADRLLGLQEELLGGHYRPGPYTHFYIHEPKRRCISAAAFRDRVVHHAVCNVIEPGFEARFIPDSYANRVGRGNHRAVERLREFVARYRYVLRLDIVKHFPAIDHAILLSTLAGTIDDPRLLELVRRIIDSGKDVLDQAYDPPLFPGDDLLSLCRPRGLPIGNLTSQFWSNCYLHQLDLFVTRELGCDAYLRYVDDFALFSDAKSTLWDWKRAVRDKLAALRLQFHPHSALSTEGYFPQ